MIFKSLKYKRFAAMFLDLVIISIFTTLLFSNSISNPKYNEYLEVSKDYTKVVTEVPNYNTQSLEELNDYVNKVSDITYRYQKSNIFFYVWYVVLSFLYFVVFQFSTGGKTLGKRLYRIKVTNKESNKNISLFRLIGKYLLVGEFYLFDGIVIISMLNIVGSLLINDVKVLFFYTVICNLIGILIEVAMIISFLTSKTNETISDKIFKTKVIEMK